MKLRIFSLLTACVLSLTVLAGCGEGETPTPSGGETTPTTTVTTTAPTTAAPTTPSVDTAKYNRLTGEYDNAAGGSSRPVAVMIGNNTKSRPQVGIANADMYVEAETEGGITRIMAVFSDVSRLPEQICPIRSARSPFVLMAQALDSVYVHAGGSVAGLQTLENSGVNSINALGNYGSTFWRDAELRASRGLEYSLSTSGQNLAAISKNYRQTSDRAPFTFAEEITGGTDCTQLQVTHSRSQSNCFVYDASRGVYKKYVGQLGSASVHVTTDGSPLEVTNVVVMYDTKYAENETTINFNLSSGSGLLVSGGKARDIQWSRSENGLSFTENGKPATFLAGKTYICIVAAGNKSSTVIK